MTLPSVLQAASFRTQIDKWALTTYRMLTDHEILMTY